MLKQLKLKIRLWNHPFNPFYSPSLDWFYYFNLGLTESLGEQFLKGLVLNQF